MTFSSYPIEKRGRLARLYLHGQATLQPLQQSKLRSMAEFWDTGKTPGSENSHPFRQFGRERRPSGVPRSPIRRRIELIPGSPSYRSIQSLND